MVRQPGAGWNDWMDASDGSETNELRALKTAIVERRLGGSDPLTQRTEAAMNIHRRQFIASLAALTTGAVVADVRADDPTVCRTGAPSRQRRGEPRTDTGASSGSCVGHCSRRIGRLPLQRDGLHRDPGQARTN